MYQRQRAHLDGIAEVESFTETEIVALSSLGRILIEGEQMHIDAFHAETGVLELHGKLQGICYLEDRPERGKGFFAKLLR
ncbi:MAG: hypothetical protein IKV57_08650 [Clostridia bacterium]|nr:hypothetical protein [Clostridia bacterium]